MSTYVVILKEDWDSNSETVDCYFIEDSLAKAEAHKDYPVQEGNQYIKNLPRCNFEATGVEIDLTLVDSDNSDHDYVAKAIICVSK
ncbi:MAG: hypothetical protein WBW55_12265 [Desulfobaccales bacterium]